MQYFNITSLSSRRHGFTLIELSIVLVIIGLLTGGVLAGQQLIRAAQLRAITVEKDKFVVALNAFKEKYHYYPGDLYNAYQFWGATCGTNTTTVGTGCNGNGDGYIHLTASAENVKVWEHLARAGLIEGTYDGDGALNGTEIVLSATNAPLSRFPQGFWDIEDMSSASFAYSDMAGYSFPSTERQVLHFGSLSPGLPTVTEHPTLTRAEAWNIDSKIDDGRANTGKVRGHALLECSDLTTDYYNLQGTNGGNRDTADCVLHFITR